MGRSCRGLPENACVFPRPSPSPLSRVPARESQLTPCAMSQTFCANWVPARAPRMLASARVCFLCVLHLPGMAWAFGRSGASERLRARLDLGARTRQLLAEERDGLRGGPVVDRLLGGSLLPSLTRAEYPRSSFGSPQGEPSCSGVCREKPSLKAAGTRSTDVGAHELLWS